MQIAEFFAGIGLVRLGLERAGWETVFANDIAEQKYEMYAQNFQDIETHFRLDDIHNLNGADIPTITLATASFPCNDTSLAGGYRGLVGNHSSALWEFIRILREMGMRRPPIILLENVFSFISSNGGQDITSVLCALNDLGYACDVFSVDAVHFVPQSRLRLFVVGVLQGQLVETQNLALSARANPELRPQKIVDLILNHPEIDWSIRELPPLPRRNLSLENILEDIPHNSDLWWSRERTEYLRSQMSERHASIANQMTQADQYQYGTIFRRVRNKQTMAELRFDGIAGCLRTPRGGSGKQILFKAGRGQYFARLLTPRECGRLQGVPDSYRIEVVDTQAFFGFGDAVCVPVIEWIAENYLNPVFNAIAGHSALLTTSI